MINPILYDMIRCPLMDQKSIIDDSMELLE